MRPVVLQVFELSLDGIIGEEDTEFYKFCRAVPDDPAYEAWLASSLESAGLHVVGRVTYEGMAGYFPGATGALADAMNRTPKAVFSRTLRTADWAGTTIMSGDVTARLAELRSQGTGEILVHGGASFAQSLAGLDVVDEYRLTVFPFLAVHGRRLFADLAGPHAVELVSSTTFDHGLIAQVYRRAAAG